MSRNNSAVRPRTKQASKLKPKPPSQASAASALLKEWRTARGLTQHEAALHIGVDDISYNRYERGRRLPSLKTAGLIAERTGLAVPVADWLEAA